MSLRFVLGSSGAGKTRYIYDEIIRKSMENPHKNYIIVVPEQFTMETQKDIVTLHERHGVMNIDIVSFNRLAFRIFEELGINRLSILDDTGKTLILRRVIEASKDKLLLFCDKIKYFGFVEEMKSSLSELYQYGITEDDLEAIIGKMDGHKNTAMKLHDIKIIFDAFREYVKNMSGDNNVYITKEEVLSKLCDAVDSSEIIKNSEIYMDGFTGFTPVQNRLISLLLTYSGRVTITATLPENECEKLTSTGFSSIKEHELFAMSKETINSMMSLAADKLVQIETPVIVPRGNKSRFADNSTLDHIERNLFRYDKIVRYDISKDKEKAFAIYGADNAMNEADFVAEKMVELIMNKDEGYRYRDIAVVTGDLDGMKRNIERAFTSRNIPHFMDNKRSLIKNPFVNIIRSILEMADDNFSYESVFAYLKNDMSVLDREETDLLENYVLGCGIKGKKAYSESFTKRYKGISDEEFDRCEGIRVKLMSSIGSFFQNDLKHMTVKEISGAIRQFVAESNYEEKLINWCDEFRQQEMYSLEAEFKQAYKLVIELFDKMDSLLGEEKLTLKEYRRLLDDGFEEIKVGIIPMVMDQVVVGDIERTRLNHVKVLFVMGVNDGIIPAHSGKPGLLSQNDRNVLKNLNIELSPSVREHGFIQKFYLYLNLTKPSKKLIMTYSNCSPDGNAIRPSYLIGTIKDMFDNLSVGSCKRELSDNAFSKEEAFNQVALGIKKYGHEDLDAKWLELFSYFARNAEYKDSLARAIAGAFYTNNDVTLDKAVAKALYGDSLGKSITRLEKYAKCAYAHFLMYGLKLVERPEYEIKATDMGNIFHSAIELFSRKIVEENLDFNDITEEKRKSLVDEVVTAVTSGYGGNVFASSARNKYMIEKVKRVTDRSAWAIIEHIKKGNFEPKDFEVKLTEGRIDRVDGLKSEEDIFVKIIDYKSGSTKFDPVDVENGVQLQLVYYMDAMLKREKSISPSKNVIPAGAFYFNIKDPIIDYEETLTDDDIVASKLLAEYKMTGIMNSREEVITGLDKDIESKKKGSDVVKVKSADKGVDIKVEATAGIMSTENFENIIKHVRGKVEQFSEEILDGRIDITPYKKKTKTACEYCPLKRVCAFDTKEFENSYSKLGATSYEEVQKKWEKLGKED